MSRRMPVRDPIAGILSDWFGIRNNGAKMLLALYRSDAPLTTAELVNLTGMATELVKACAWRDLRGAGLELVSGRSGQGYALSPTDRAAIREAFAHALGLLGREVPTPDELEYAIEEFRQHREWDGMAVEIASLRRAFGVIASVAHLLLVLHRAHGRHVAVARLNVLIPSRRQGLFEESEPKRITVFACWARKALASAGVTDAIETLYGYGYRLTPSGAAQVEAALHGAEG